MKELVVCVGEGGGGYMDTLKLGRLIKTHICILQLGLVTPCFAVQ
jgi:hypothetical protein